MIGLVVRMRLWIDLGREQIYLLYVVVIIHNSSLQGALTECNTHQKDQNSIKCANNRNSEFYLRQFAMY